MHSLTIFNMQKRPTRQQEQFASYDPINFMGDQSFDLGQIKTKSTLNDQIKKSKQLKERLNRFLANKNGSTDTTQNTQNRQKVYSIESEEVLRGSLQGAQSTLSGGAQKNPHLKRAYRPSLILLSSTGSNQSGQEPIDKQENESKRSKVYEHDTCKQSFENLDQSTIESNNKIFQMVFLKKGNQNESFSTNSSNKKNMKFKQQESIRIEHFQLGKKLGAGKSGQVFAARHKTSGFLVAIKKIRKDIVDPKTLTQLIRQIKIQSYLDHPNIVKLYNFFSDQNHIYLALQYCASGDLYTLLKKSRRMEEPTVQNIIKQVCKAIEYMHENTILHRDLKPENILFHNGMIKICDFGWSISSTVSRQTFCGTPLYVSPELLKRNNYSNKIDVWSIGILTHELLFGRVPFDIFTQGDLIKIVEDDIRFSKHIPITNDTKSFIMSCLQKDPRDRLSVSDLLQQPFLTQQIGTIA